MQDAIREDALETAVVDGQHGRKALELRLIAVHAPQEYRDECGVPVVRMENQVAFADPARDFDRSRRKQREAIRIVGVVAAALAVNPGAIERRVVLEEERVREAVAHLAPAADFFQPATAFDLEGVAERLEL